MSEPIIAMFAEGAGMVGEAMVLAGTQVEVGDLLAT
jgi:hypothetical protein